MARRDDAGRDLLLAWSALREGLIEPGAYLEALKLWDAAGRRGMAGILAEAQEAGATETVAYDGPSLSQSALSGDPNGERRGLDDGRFRAIRSHARGGLGEVFVAFDPELNRTVALKELRPYHAFDALSQSRFLLEAEITGRLEHPGVVPVYGLGRYADGRPYYAMRFIEGETLKEAIARFHGLKGDDPAARELLFRRLLQSLIDVCNAVAFAHSRGVVHRDIKPENVILGRYGETLLVDWGLAKVVAQEPERAEGVGPWPDRVLDGSTLTVAGTIVGTPRYMSPEQADGDPRNVGPASDIYSLGATLYCLLVGHAPFPDDDIADVLAKVRRGIFPSPRRLVPAVDPTLEATCLRAMSLRPEDRHPNPLALAGEIEAWLADVRYRAEQGRALDQVKRSLALLCFERAKDMFGRDKHDEGMLWMARALENVPGDSARLEHAIRAGLSAWHVGPKLLERRLAHAEQVRCVAFSPDGRQLVTGGSDRSAKIWDLAAGVPLARPIPHESPIVALAYAKDRPWIVSLEEGGTVRLWETLGGEPAGPPLRPEGRADLYALSPDGLTVATARGTESPALRSVETGEYLLRPEGVDARVLILRFDPEGRRLAAGTDDGVVRIWESTTGRPLGGPILRGASALDLTFSPDGRRLAIAGADDQAELWDLETGAIVFPLAPPAKVAASVFSPDGSIVATSFLDGTARLWESATGRPIGEPLAHAGPIAGLAFSPDGLMIASGSRDGTLRFWDTSTALPIGPPLEHRGAILALAFSPDGRHLATGGAEGTARYWKVPSPLVGDVERISCWTRVSTGLDFDPGDAIRPLDHLAGWEFRRRLQDLGGPPVR